MTLFVKIFIGLCCFFSFNLTFAVEKLQYQAFYQGVLSLYNKLEIADIHFTIQPLENAIEEDALTKIALSVSSQNYPMVESLYSFRYFYQSIFDKKSHQTLFFENLKSSKNLTHNVVLFDLPKQQVQLFSSKNNSPVLPEQISSQLIRSTSYADAVKSLALDIKATPVSHQDKTLIDRLSLLEEIRAQLMLNQQTNSYLLTNGDELMRYQFTHVKDEDIIIAGKTINTKKIKIEGFDLNKKESHFEGDDESILRPVINEKQYLHPPVYVWFSNDKRCIPIKFISRRAIGDFVIQIMDDAKS